MRRYRIPHCEECSFLKHKEINGDGFCKVFNDKCYWGGFCMLDHTRMSVKETLRVLHEYQKWRRGAWIKMPNPYVVSQAIDSAIRLLRKNLK